MTQRERESVSPPPAAGPAERDPHSFLFGDDADYVEDGSGYPPPLDGDGTYGSSGYADYAPPTRADRRRDRARRRRLSRRGWTFVLVIALVVAAIVAVGVPWSIHHFGSHAVADYPSGQLGPQVTVSVHTGDDANAIGTTLTAAGVVSSKALFVSAYSANAKAESIQPGRYRLNKHMPAAQALSALLDPTSRLQDSNLPVPEGSTEAQVRTALTKCYGAQQQSAVNAALQSTALRESLLSYKVGSSFPSTLEGFLYPATYTCDPTVPVATTVQSMIFRFLRADRSLGFADTAQKTIGPYRTLIIASIAQSEAKFPQDMPKVTRTILNRLAIGKHLELDSTSSYACKQAGTPASQCRYDSEPGPYNTYRNAGLPPTPIDNPGDSALDASTHPASGKYLWFVTIDAAGHLGFFDNDKDFGKAVAKCQKNHWCG